ncbi:hypothetical protein ACFQRK_04535 [Parapedobacter sp. GCM10030251]|uniref:hypothetical protein n=1 Tax=Parapedobacter sp. GCM10030251 TaxID=3273419 RepID=UPI00361ED0A8
MKTYYEHKKVSNIALSSPLLIKTEPPSDYGPIHSTVIASVQHPCNDSDRTLTLSKFDHLG